MANYFTYFSLVLPLDTEQRKYAVQIVEQVTSKRENDSPLPESFPAELIDHTGGWFFETEAQEEGLWLHSTDGGIDAVCALIQHLLVKFNFAPSVGFEWSNDCSEPETDAYGGGAVFITRTEIESMNTADWLRSMDC